ncbi:MAG TPA: S8 family serine peptidase [Gemmatimonadales bacterium]
MALPSLSVAGAAGDGSGTYLVRFKGKGIPADFASRVGALGGEVVFAHAGVGIAAVSGLDDASATSIAARGDVAAVDPDMVVELEPMVGGVEQVVAEPTSPADPASALRFSRQWNMKTIQADLAWAAGKTGSETVRVGILDTGIDYLHPDLVGRVDLGASRSFLSAAENARVQAAFPGAHEIADLNYHGTHVAATVASNAYIYAGVTSQVKLVGLKVCSPGTAANGFRGSCPSSGTFAAILYAADIGLPVINLSLGGRWNRRDASARGGFGPSFIATINQVMSYAERKGTTVVVSAGNDAIDIDHDGNGYKTYCSAPNTVCVSATGPVSQASADGPWQDIDALADYSNYGRSAISVAAPGGNRVSVTAACSGFTIHPSLLVCRNRHFNSPTDWSAFSVGLSGTSMAAPHTSGVAALIASEGITSPSRIRARLQQSADDLGQPGVDPAYGKGRINAARAVGLD